jgi:CPA2 family monovalent cation:H+ antiporter-2
MSFQGFLATSILTMLVTPVLFRFAPDVSFWIQKLKKTSAEPLREAEKTKKLKGHVIIAGFGLNGQNLAQVLTETHIPFVVIDLNPNTLQRAREKNFPAIYGDSSDPDILLKAGIKEAQVFVIAISDPIAARRVVAISKKMNQNLHVLVRTRYVVEIDELYRAGADQVIPEEFETSVEIFSRVLQEYRIPRNVIELQAEFIRQNRYGMLRGLSLKGEILAKLPEILSQTTVETFLLLENSLGVDSTVHELDLHGKTGVVLMAVVRDGKGVAAKDLQVDFRFEMGDILILVGSHAQLDEARKYLTGSKDD